MFETEVEQVKEGRRANEDRGWGQKMSTEIGTEMSIKDVSE